MTHWGFSRQGNKPLAVEVNGRPASSEWNEPEEVIQRPRPVPPPHHQHPQVDTYVVHPPPPHQRPPARPPATWTAPTHRPSAPRPAPVAPVLSTDGWKPMSSSPEKPKSIPLSTSFKGQPGFQFYDSRLTTTSPPPAAYRPAPTRPHHHHSSDENDPVVYKPNVHHPFLEPEAEKLSKPGPYATATTKPPLHPLYPIHEYHDKTKPYYQLVPAHLTSNKKPHTGYSDLGVIPHHRPKPQQPHDQHDTMIRPEDYEYMEEPPREPPPNSYNNNPILNKRPPYPPPPHVDYQPDEQQQPERPKYHSGYPPAPVTAEPPLNRKPGQVTAYQDPLPLPPSYRPATTQSPPNVYDSDREPQQVEIPSRRPGQLSVYKKPFIQPHEGYERPSSYVTEAPEYYEPRPRPTPFTAYNKRPAITYTTTTEQPIRQAPKPWTAIPSTTEIPQTYEDELEDDPEPPRRRPTYSPTIKPFRPKSTTTTTPVPEEPDVVIYEVTEEPPPPPKRRPPYSPSIKPFRPKQRPYTESADETESTTRRSPYKPVSKRPTPSRYDAGHQNDGKPIRTTTTTTTTTTNTPKIYESSVDDEVIIERPRKKQPAKKQPNQDTATEILNRLKLKHTVMDHFGMRTQPLTHTEESRTKQTYLAGDVELIETDDEARIILRKGNKYKMADLSEFPLIEDEPIEMIFPDDSPEFEEFQAQEKPKMKEIKETLAELKAKVLSSTTTTSAPDYETLSSIKSTSSTRKSKKKGVKRRNNQSATARIAKRKDSVGVKKNETSSTTKGPPKLVRLPSKVRSVQQTTRRKPDQNLKGETNA